MKTILCLLVLVLLLVLSRRCLPLWLIFYLRLDLFPCHESIPCCRLAFLPLPLPVSPSSSCLSSIFFLFYFRHPPVYVSSSFTFSSYSSLFMFHSSPFLLLFYSFHSLSLFLPVSALFPTFLHASLGLIPLTSPPTVPSIAFPHSSRCSFHSLPTLILLILLSPSTRSPFILLLFHPFHLLSHDHTHKDSLV